MGRKIPGRKHHGVRDPEKQQARILASVAQKINCPPKNNDEQAIPKSVLRIQELQSKMKTPRNHQIKKKTKKPHQNKIGMFKQRIGETDKSFMFRINKTTQEVLMEAEFAEKYKVDIIRNKDTGKVETVQKRSKDEIEQYLEKVKKDKKTKGKKKKKNADEVTLTKSQKKRKKLLLKKEQRVNIHADDLESVGKKDHVKFGEIVHGPPALSLPRRSVNILSSASVAAQRPGARNLLLKTVLQPSYNDSLMHNKTANRVIDKKAKRKDLPKLLRNQLESNQQAAIIAYKQLKANKYKQ